MSSSQFDTAPEAIGAPAWVVSFADMSLLLLSFFVMMLTTTTPEFSQDEDVLKILASIKLGFGYEPKANPREMAKIDAEVLQQIAERDSGRSRRPTQPMLSPAAIPGKRFRDKDEIVREKGALGGPVLFDRHATDVDESKRKYFSEIGQSLGTSRTVVVIGHCSPEEAKTSRDGGFQLAFARAMAVRQVLVDSGVSPGQVRVVSCASSETQNESASPVQRRAIVTLGRYYVPSQRLASN